MSMVDDWNAIDDAWAQIEEALEKNDNKVSFGDPDIFPLLDEYLRDAQNDNQDMVFYETQYRLTKNAVATTMSLYAEGEIDFAKFTSGMNECNEIFTNVTAAVLHDMECRMEANIGKLIEEKQAAHFVSAFFARIKCYLEEGLNEHYKPALGFTIEPFLEKTKGNPTFAEVYDKFYNELINQDESISESALEETAEKLLSLIQKEEENLIYSEKTIAKWIEDSIKNDGILETNNGLGVEFNSTANSKEINIACRASNAKLMNTLAERADVTSGEVLENTDVVAFGISSDKKEPYAVINGYEIPLTKPEQEVVREIFMHQMIQDCNLELNAASKNFNHNMIETYAKIGTEEIEKLASMIAKEISAGETVRDIVKDFDFPTLAALSHELSGTSAKWEIRDIAAEKEIKAFEQEYCNARQNDIGLEL